MLIHNYFRYNILGKVKKYSNISKFEFVGVV
jgi:hypothetical protein